MIKINLASRKQSVAIEGKGSSGTSLTSQLSGGLEGLKDLPIRKFAVPVIVGLMASYVLESHKEEELQKATAAISKLTVEKTKLEAEAGQMRGEEERKKALEADEVMIKTKLEVLRKLIAERAVPPKLLMTLSGALPKDVWLSSFKLQNSEVSIKGYSLGFSQISDFMKSLSESAYYTDVALKTTEQNKENMGSETAVFELSAKQR